ncbi:MAG: hypothetical protein HQ559_17205 [Lentisphaerae bacterium]|nr:hypothetical protein [Lentisphaerota bacterium]
MHFGRISLRLLTGAIFIAFCVSTAQGLVQDFSHYEVIIQRKPFGEPPAKPVVVPPPAPPVQPARPPPFVRTLRMVGITDSKYGVRVGIVDISKKPPTSYYMAIDDIEDGIHLLDGDYDEEAALVRKDGKEWWLYLDGRQGGEAPGLGGASASAPAGGVAAQPSKLPTSSARKGYYARRLERRKEILDARRKANDERVKSLAPEELQKQIREYNLELIRARGKLGPPLPIQLTPEEDSTLVDEGVLPPQ